MSESYETDIPAQSQLTGGNDRGPNQPGVLRNNLQEEDINLPQLQGGNSKKDEFLFIEESEPLSKSDHVKNYIQAFTSMPIIWWPFSDPRRPLEQGKTRITWQCVRNMVI